MTTATLNEQVTNIQSFNWASYPTIAEVNIFTYEPQVTIRNGVTLAQNYSQYTITVLLHGNSPPHLLSKYVTVTSNDSLTDVTTLMQNSAMLMTDMVLGTDTESQHAIVDRGHVINFNGKKVQ